MFRRPRPCRDTPDEAFDKAEAAIRGFGAAVASQISEEFKAGRIDSPGIDERIELAMSQAASAPVAGVPRFAMKQLLASLHESIVAELADAGITWEQPAP